MTKHKQEHDEMDQIRVSSLRWMKGYYITLALALVLFIVGQVFAEFQGILPYYLVLIGSSMAMFVRSAYLSAKYKKLAYAKLAEISRKRYGAENK